MDELRLILLVIGAIVIVGVYLYSRQGASRRERRNDPFGGKLEVPFGEHRVNARDEDEELPDDLPPLHATDAFESTDATDEDSDVVSAGDEKVERGPTPPRDEKIVVLNILPVDSDARFPGSDLLDVFDRAGLEYGQFDVFHRVKETSEGPQSVFSVASATEPGSFDITAMAEESFKGLTLFMVLPGPMRGVDAFADMLATSRRIAEQIRGEVKDRNRSTLTRQTAHHIREEIIAFEHRPQHAS